MILVVRRPYSTEAALSICVTVVQYYVFIIPANQLLKIVIGRNGKLDDL